MPSPSSPEGQRPKTLWVCPECGWSDLNALNFPEPRCRGKCAEEWRAANNRTGEGFLRTYGAARTKRDGVRGVTMVGDSDNYPLCVPVEVIPVQEAQRLRKELWDQKEAELDEYRRANTTFKHIERERNFLAERLHEAERLLTRAFHEGPWMGGAVSADIEAFLATREDQDDG